MSIINTHDSLKQVADSFQASATKNQKQDATTGITKENSFSKVLADAGNSFIKDVQGVESAMQKYSNGELSAEDIVMQTKAITLEVEGVMGITRTVVESAKKILDMQI